jgi:hypothetical protein
MTVNTANRQAFLKVGLMSLLVAVRRRFSVQRLGRTDFNNYVCLGSDEDTNYPIRGMFVYRLLTTVARATVPHRSAETQS